MLKKVSVLDDGNCAYYAFLLGILDLSHEGEFDDKEEEQKKILELVNKFSAFKNIKSWDAFKNKLATVSEPAELNNIQEELGAPLRALTSAQMKEKKNIILPLIQAEIVDAFQSYVTK